MSECDGTESVFDSSRISPKDGRASLQQAQQLPTAALDTCVLEIAQHVVHASPLRQQAQEGGAQGCKETEILHFLRVIRYLWFLNYINYIIAAYSFKEPCENIKKAFILPLFFIS